MLSICIPIFNSDASALVSELLNQMDESNEEVELIVIDDSSDSYHWNSAHINHPRFTHISLSTNIGRSRIRNYFLTVAKFPYLLYIDGDSTVCDKNFLRMYLDKLKVSNVEVMCGASIYQKERPSSDYYLRWKYSKLRESHSATYRLSNQVGFKTNNFLIKRSVLEKIPFEEKLIGYGHEDTLFGFQLAKFKVNVEHIENPVLNKTLDSNKAFLIKTVNAVKNLTQILEFVDNDQQFITQNRIIKTYFSLKEKRLLKTVHAILWVINPLNNWLLSRGIFILPMFDLFKLKQLIFEMNQLNAR